MAQHSLFRKEKPLLPSIIELMAGAKGVGRFSCDRLEWVLNLIYEKENSADYIKLFVDWKKFEIEDDKDMEIQSMHQSFMRL